MTILVVGGAGYLGSHTARALRRSGFDVLIYDNLSTGHLRLVKVFEVLQGDIADVGRLARAVYRADAVLHFASASHTAESVADPRRCFRTDVESSLTLLNTCLACGVRKVVFSSSGAVYGNVEEQPVAETVPRQPMNPCGVAKLFFEHALDSYDRAYGLVCQPALRQCLRCGRQRQDRRDAPHSSRHRGRAGTSRLGPGLRQRLPYAGWDVPSGLRARQRIGGSPRTRAALSARRRRLGDSKPGYGTRQFRSGGPANCGIDHGK
jgi:NAD dependent epimerase/dehydratase family